MSLEQLKTYRDTAAQALVECRKVKDALAAAGVAREAWPQEKQAEFDKWLGDFRMSNEKAEKLAAELAKDSELDEATKKYVAGDGEQEKVTYKAQATGETFQGSYVRIREQFNGEHSAAVRSWLRTGRKEPLERFAKKLSRAEQLTFFGDKDTAEQFALSSIIGDLGGVLAPPDMRSVIIREEGTFSVMRREVSVERTGRDKLEMPTIQSGSDVRFPSGYRGGFKQAPKVVGGAALPTQDQPKTGLIGIPVHDWTPDATEIPMNLLNDSEANVEAIIGSIIAETKGIEEDDKILNGVGNGEPEGFLQAGLTTVKSLNASLLTKNGLIDLFTSVPPQYQEGAKFVMNLKSFGALLKLEDTAGQPLFPINSPPNTLFGGKPIVFSEWMPDVAASATPIIYGHLKLGYMLAERQDVRIQRLTERFAPNIGLQPTARYGGQVVRSRALRVQKVEA